MEEGFISQVARELMEFRMVLFASRMIGTIYNIVDDFARLLLENAEYIRKVADEAINKGNVEDDYVVVEKVVEKGVLNVRIYIDDGYLTIRVFDSRVDDICYVRRLGDDLSLCANSRRIVLKHYEEPLLAFIIPSK